ncbi:sulfur carrier protein ThiS [Thermodesulfobacteriota bacterium]
MIIKVNGENYSTEKEKTAIDDLLKEKKVEMPEMVSVQLNGNFVKRENFSATHLKENDEVEFLYFMGGGSL